MNGTLKNELVYRSYTTRKAAMDDIARWIELRYNRLVSTPRSGIGHRRKSWTST